MPYIEVKEDSGAPDVGVIESDSPDGQQHKPGEVFYAPRAWIERRLNVPWLATISKQEFERRSSEADTVGVPDEIRPEGVPAEIGEEGLKELSYNDGLVPLASNLDEIVDAEPESRESSDLREFIFEALQALEGSD